MDQVARQQQNNTDLVNVVKYYILLEIGSLPHRLMSLTLQNVDMYVF